MESRQDKAAAQDGLARGVLIYFIKAERRILFNGFPKHHLCIPSPVIFRELGKDAVADLLNSWVAVSTANDIEQRRVQYKSRSVRVADLIKVNAAKDIK